MSGDPDLGQSNLMSSIASAPSGGSPDSLSPEAAGSISPPNLKTSPFARVAVAWSRLGEWLGRQPIAVWGILIAGLLETAILGWVQWQNYQSFVSTQGNLGNYNQALYTFLHGQGFFYYTTNIPEGNSSGSIWAVHFAPDLLILVPLYAIAPSPVTLIILKQLALALAALPLYGFAKTYFRTELIPVIFAALYLLSPLTLTTDWNTFDLEPLFPLPFLLSLYFFSRGRTWLFLACWVLALGAIEATAPFLALFAAGGLAGTFLDRTTSSSWSAKQQRRPLLIALVISLVWLGASFLILYYAGGRGGAFGNAYAVRYSTLGATSLPDVLPRALLHPSAAVTALQYGGWSKVLFLELILLSTGALWIVGGLRYLLPVGAYVALALLSNDPAAYGFGKEQPVLILGFLFAGSVEGAYLLLRWLNRNRPEKTRVEQFNRLEERARELARRIKILEASDRPLGRRLKSQLSEVVVCLKAGDLDSAERSLGVLAQSLPAESGSNAEGRPSIAGGGAGSSPSVARSSGQRRIDRRSWRRSIDTPQLLVVAILVVCIVPSAILAGPLLSNPLGAAPEARFGYIGPNADDQALQRVLDLIPPSASVLTTPHIFPQLSNRPDAFVVPTEGSRPNNGTIANVLNGWANESTFIAIDYNVDPTNSVILRNETNLSGFGLYASDDGAILYERGWGGSPVLWTPWASAIAGGTLTLKPGEGSVSSQYASSLGPSFYHPPNATVNGTLWTGPADAFLPHGSYFVTFNVELVAPVPGAQVLLKVVSAPGYVEDKPVLTVGGQTIRQALLVASPLPPTEVSQTRVFTATAIPSATAESYTIPFEVTSTGFYSFPGEELSATMSLYLVSIVIVQASAFV